MKRILFITIAVVFFYCTAYAAEYKSFAELHPELAIKHNIAALGETVTSEDVAMYRVMAECKHPDFDMWIQWVDFVSHGKPFDGVCDFAAFLKIEDGALLTKPLACIEASVIITKWCVENNIPIDDYIHSAPINEPPKYKPNPNNA